MYQKGVRPARHGVLQHFGRSRPDGDQWPAPPTAGPGVPASGLRPGETGDHTMSVAPGTTIEQAGALFDR